MSLTKPNYAVNNIQTLADITVDQATAVKVLHDKTGKDNKDYLTDILTVEIDTLDAANVKLTGNQTVAGIKTFSSSPIVPTPTTDSQASTKKYVDDKDTAQTNALTAHKLSGDHDSRYFTETEIGASTGTSGAEIVGSKTITGVTGNTVWAQLSSLYTLIVNVVLGQIPDNSLDTVKYKDGSVTAAKCAADVATQSELDAAVSSVNSSITDLAGAGRTTETVKDNADNIATHLAETVSYVTGITRDISVTGVQTVTLPFRAKSLQVIGCVPSTKMNTNGFWSDNSKGCVYSIGSVASYIAEGNAVLVFSVDGVNLATASVQNVTATGFELLWAKVSSPTGTATIFIQAETHY